MSSIINLNKTAYENKHDLSTINKSGPAISTTTSKLPIIIGSVISISIITVILGIALPLSISSNKKPKIRVNYNGYKNESENNSTDTDTDKEEEEYEDENIDDIIYDNVNKNNYIKAILKENFTIPSDGKIQVIGADFPQKNIISIIGRNDTIFNIDDNGTIEGITKDDFPLYYSFNDTIINGSFLFKDVNCFKQIDLSKMDSSKLIDCSYMFENSKFEQIIFNSRNKYFNTTEIKTAKGMFLNCTELKKIVFPPIFNVGKSANSMFKGCTKLNNVNTSCISSSEIEDMKSMFEDCISLKTISFSNSFLTGEVKSLSYTFKNTHLDLLDISYLRLFNLIYYIDIFYGCTIKGILKLGKYYSNENVRDDFFR